MKLVIGGYAQGKLNYVLLKYHIRKDRVYTEIRRKEMPEKETIIINHFHNWVKERILDHGCPEQELLLFLEEHNNCIIISDEIGNGIVPVDPMEREYRERMGRILIRLAQQAEEVERVICGIGQKIK